MTYDLAVWEGSRPRSDDAAGHEFERVMERLESDEPDPPTPAIEAFVAELLQRWPELDGDVGEDSPWASEPVLDGASGGALYLNLITSRVDEAAPYVAELARRHGLVCFDPQMEALLPLDERPPRLFEAFRR